jgi:hypothetical protein
MAGQTTYLERIIKILLLWVSLVLAFGLGIRFGQDAQAARLCKRAPHCCDQ